MASCNPDSVGVVARVWQRLAVRLTVFAATVIVGGLFGAALPDLIPIGIVWEWGPALVSVPLILSLIAFVVLVRSESATAACVALAMNCAASLCVTLTICEALGAA